MKKQPLTLKDFTGTFICIGIGLTLATGLLTAGEYYRQALTNDKTFQQSWEAEIKSRSRWEPELQKLSHVVRKHFLTRWRNW